jgi:hypothetical protein
LANRNGLAYIGWQGIRVGWWQPCLRLGFELSLLMAEPEWLFVGGAAPTGAPL